jgi:hypothetical protein
MKISQIISQLWQTLPRFTDLFSDTQGDISLSKNGSVVTATCLLPHGLTTGDYIFVNGALTPIDIESLTSSNGIATAVTLENHDLTEGYQDTVQISGADQSEYNGIHNLLTVPNRRTFTFSISGTPISPATGQIVLISNLKYGYNGLQQITVVDDSTFTYVVENDFGTPALGDISIQKNIRISGAVSIERATEAYTKQEQNKCWMFCISGNHSASRDIYTKSDVLYKDLFNTDFRQTVMHEIFIYVFIPTVYSISAVYERDLMEDIQRYLFKSILRLRVVSDFEDQTEYCLVFTGHSFFGYERAYYIHEFKFEYVYDLTYQDAVDEDDSVAFRDIRLQFRNEYDQNIINNNVDLDDIPLT